MCLKCEAFLIFLLFDFWVIIKGSFFITFLLNNDPSQLSADFTSVVMDSDVPEHDV